MVGAYIDLSLKERAKILKESDAVHAKRDGDHICHGAASEHLVDLLSVDEAAQVAHEVVVANEIENMNIC